MRRDGKVAPSILISMQDNQLSIPDILDPLFPLLSSVSDKIRGSCKVNGNLFTAFQRIGFSCDLESLGFCVRLLSYSVGQFCVFSCCITQQNLIFFLNTFLPLCSMNLTGLQILVSNSELWAFHRCHFFKLTF